MLSSEDEEKSTDLNSTPSNDFNKRFLQKLAGADVLAAEYA